VVKALEEVYLDQLGAVTAKQIYAAMTETLPPPKVEAKRPELGWRRIWQNLHTVGLPLLAADIMFCMLHNVLPLQARQHRLGVADSAACRRCDATVEDSVHFFTRCPRVADAWASLATADGQVLGGPLPDLHLLFLHLPAAPPLLAVILAVVVYVELAWATRDEPGLLSPQDVRNAVQVHVKPHLPSIFNLV
jgi:zinc-binding in reverse transcriptase